MVIPYFITDNIPMSLKLKYRKLRHRISFIGKPDDQCLVYRRPDGTTYEVYSLGHKIITKEEKKKWKADERRVIKEQYVFGYVEPDDDDEE